MYDHRKVERGVTNILAAAPPAGYGTTGVTGVACPVNQPVIASTTLDRTAPINGATKNITITIIDSGGKYEVGLPNQGLTCSASPRLVPT